MLRDRLKSALIALVVILPLLFFGGVVGVAVLVAAFGGVAVWELSRNLSVLKDSPCRELTILFFLSIVAVFHVFSVNAAFGFVVLLPLAILLLHLFLFNSQERTVESATQMILVCAYIGVPLAHAVLLRRLDMGVAWVFFVLVVISLGDVGAYFAGKYYGQHHFSKNVSPGKTVEGLGGGLAGNLLGMLLLKLLVPALPPLGVLIQITLVLAVVGPLGDLVASAIKRRLGIKDFGFIMPGHGGVLDRADALIPAFPLTYFFLILSGISVPQ
jgi:phosphatidate cytidylyltransferase